MASTTRGNGLPQFILTPQQQNLLFRALTSNQPATSDKSPDNHPLSLSPQSLTTSPTQNHQGSGSHQPNGHQESPFVDYDYDFSPDGGFDFDFATDGSAKMIGDLPGSATESTKDDSKSASPENENPDKRGLEEDDDEDQEEGGGKRRESEGKVPKKPGRKPLTNEPSSKRKAQNRAAQRAFRERKEKHVKDLETKVEELEKASNSANNENSQLRSQIEKLTTELNEYRKRMSLMGHQSHPSTSSQRSQPFGSGAVQNLGDVNFQFDFPKFGSLPAPQNNNAKRTSYPSPPSANSNSHNSPQETPRDKATPGSAKGGEGSDTQRRENSAKGTTGLNNASPYDNTYGSSTSRTSLDSTTFSVNGAAGASPCSSSNSNLGPSSSCGTSPEPFTQSPGGFKPMDTLTTIGEEQSSLTSNAAPHGFGSSIGNIDFGNLDWLSQQNGGQFDPQLFGDYREPQNNILANPTFDDTFFNDAFDIDFTTPYNMASNSPQPPKKNICDEIDAQKEHDDLPVTVVNGKLLTCNNIWEKLQTCPKVHNGEIDLDGLCSDLQKKAKCGGTGAVVDEHDFKAIMTRYLGGDAANCPDAV